MAFKLEFIIFFSGLLYPNSGNEERLLMILHFGEGHA